MTSQVAAIYLKMCVAVLRIQWCLQWISSSIRWDVMVAHYSGRCCSHNAASPWNTWLESTTYDSRRNSKLVSPQD